MGMTQAPDWEADELQDICDRMIKWFDVEENIWLGAFFADELINEAHFWQLAKKDRFPFMREALDICKAKQQAKIIQGALHKNLAEGMSKFVLINNHGWTEKTQVSGDAANPVAVMMDKIDGKSKDLVKE